MNEQKIDKAIKSIMNLLSETNSYIDDQAPWSLKKSNPERMKTVLFVIINIIIKSTIMLSPVIPTSAEQVMSFMNFKLENYNFNNFEKFIEETIIIRSPSPIFPRID